MFDLKTGLVHLRAQDSGEGADGRTLCSRFLNKNAYIQIALLGKKFCYAAKDAFWLILRNGLRIATAAMVSPYPPELFLFFVQVCIRKVGCLPKRQEWMQCHTHFRHIQTPKAFT